MNNKAYTAAWNDLFENVLTEDEQQVVLAAPSGKTSMEIGYAAACIAEGEDKAKYTAYMLTQIR
jgi:hypothetical protein